VERKRWINFVSGEKKFIEQNSHELILILFEFLIFVQPIFLTSKNKFALTW
jgi:hypothetical protein